MLTLCHTCSAQCHLVHGNTNHPSHTNTDAEMIKTAVKVALVALAALVATAAASVPAGTYGYGYPDDVEAGYGTY